MCSCSDTKSDLQHINTLLLAQQACVTILTISSIGVTLASTHVACCLAQIAGFLHLDGFATRHPLSAVHALSSSSAMLGNPGQANYAAANAALEEIIEGRQRQGLPSGAGGWGPWAGNGMAAHDAELLARLHRQGEAS